MCDVTTDAASVFDYIDQPERLSAHMSRRSWRLAGSSMAIETDRDGGRAVGSRIRLRGRMLGFELHVDGEVVERDPPFSKVWQTVGEPRLLVIGRYRMSVESAPRAAAARVTIAIDYAPPTSGLARWLGLLVGPYYARWCVQQMAADAFRRFGGSA